MLDRSTQTSLDSAQTCWYAPRVEERLRLAVVADHSSLRTWPGHAALGRADFGVIGQVADDAGRGVRHMFPPWGSMLRGYRPAVSRPGWLLPPGSCGSIGPGSASFATRNPKLHPVLVELPHLLTLFRLPGRAVCPALGTRGRWTPWHAEIPPGGKRLSQRTRPVPDQVADRGRLGCRAGWRRLRPGSGMPGTVRPAPSTLDAVGERGPPPRGPHVGPPEPPESVSAQSVLEVTRRLCK